MTVRRYSTCKRESFYKGGKKKINVEQIKALKKEGLRATAIARQVGCHRDSVYRSLKQEA